MLLYMALANSAIKFLLMLKTGKKLSVKYRDYYTRVIEFCRQLLVRL